MTDLVFLDTETLGLHPNAPIWEFAAIRRNNAGEPGETNVEVEFTIAHDRYRHNPHRPFSDGVDWIPADYPETLLADYLNRYHDADAWKPSAAAKAVQVITGGAHVIGCNPGFDLERLAKLLARFNLEPTWHYHPDDIASVNIGYLAARGELPPRPWKSDALAAAVGVAAADYARHTAMGDVRWVMAQWDRVLGDVADCPTPQAVTDAEIVRQAVMVLGGFARGGLAAELRDVADRLAGAWPVTDCDLGAPAPNPPGLWSNVVLRPGGGGASGSRASGGAGGAAGGGFGPW